MHKWLKRLGEEMWRGKAKGKHCTNLNIKRGRIKEMESGMKLERRANMAKNPCNSIDETNTTTIKMVQLELKSEQFGKENTN